MMSIWVPCGKPYILVILIQECSKINKPVGNYSETFVSGCFTFSSFLGRDYRNNRTKVHQDRGFQPINGQSFFRNGWTRIDMNVCTRRRKTVETPKQTEKRLSIQVQNEAFGRNQPFDITMDFDRCFHQGWLVVAIV